MGIRPNLALVWGILSDISLASAIEIKNIEESS